MAALKATIIWLRPSETDGVGTNLKVRKNSTWRIMKWGKKLQDFMI